MQLPVLIEPVDGNGFRAESGSPVPATAHGATREEALRNLRQTIQARLAAGAEIACVEIYDPERPHAQVAGIFKDNPLFDEWQEAIEEYRRLRDQED